MRVLGPAVFAVLFVSFAVFADVVEPIPMAPATMEELSRVPVRALRSSGHRRRPPHARSAPAALSAPSSTLRVVPEAASAVPPPKATAGFRAMGAPPDIYPADAAGAVSARYVVGAFNGGIVVQDRTGKQLLQVALDQFWADPAFAWGWVYDPQIVYDAANDRWILVALYDVEYKNGTFLIAISDSGDPTAGWKRYRVPFDQTGLRNGDRPRIGQTADAVVVSVTEWDQNIYPVGTDIFLIAKKYASAPSIEMLHFGSVYEFAPVTTSSETRQFVNAEGGVGLYQIAGNKVVNQQHYFTQPAYTQPFTQRLGPQLGSSRLMDAGDSTMQNAVKRNGALWTVQTVRMASSRTAILVWRISGGSAKTFLIEDPQMVFAFPSIAVNRFGAALVAYSVYSGTAYPSAGYSYIDPAGNLSASAILKAGDTPYIVDRWGDYTTTLVDPADDSSFWTVQVYPMFSNTWATWWSHIPVTGFSRNRAARH